MDVLALMKFGEAKYMADLLTRGDLYMQSVEFFRRLEGDLVRGDRHEGATYCRQPDRTVFEVRQGTEWFKVEGIVGPIVFREGPPITGNIYSMFALTDGHAEAAFEGRSKTFVDVDKLAFGDTVVVFTNADEFLRRVQAAAAAQGLELRYDLVEYVDPASYMGPMGPFRKFSPLAYQSEFRILTKPESATPLILSLGSLEDIATLHPRAELNQRLRLRQA
jgi:hypothetical protein